MSSALSCGEFTCEELIGDLEAVWYTKLFCISAYTILIHDYIITFSDEVDLVWSKKRGIGWGTGLFLVIRYLTLVSITFIIVVMFTDNIGHELYVVTRERCDPWTLSDSQYRCIAWIKFHWFAGVSIVILAELTLQIRIVAMYGNTRVIIAFMIFTFVATFGSIFAMIGRIISVESSIFFHPIADNDLFICVPQTLPSVFKEVWLPLFVHEAILCALALAKGIQNMRVYGKEGLRSRFTIFLVADSIQYYFAVLIVFFSLELVWVIKGENYIELPIGHALVVGSIMCQRLLLKIRRRYYSRGIGEHSATDRRTTALLEYADDSVSLSTFHVETIPSHPAV